MLIRNATAFADPGDAVFDLRIQGQTIVEIASALAPHPEEDVFDADRGALIPGLHDHHIHLRSLAAALESVDCGPPAVEDLAGLARALTDLPDTSPWIRGVGYFESVAGDLDRDLLDRLCPSRPLRIQHRSGSMWFLNSRAIDEAALDAGPTPSGVERDAAGRATGRVFRLDEWLRDRLRSSERRSLERVGQCLAASGVTGATDATPSTRSHDLEFFRNEQRSGRFPQRLHMMGDATLTGASDSSDLSIGPFKVLLDEPALPDLERLVASIEVAHAGRRAVAFHTVTRSEIHFALAALEAAGARAGDRLEHASVAPPEALAQAKRLDLTIVTQPNFVAERGDAYLLDVETRDLPHLYRLRSWLDQGIALAGGTDAPFGDPDPWRAMRAAVDRCTASGKTLGPAETLTPEQALGLFLSEPEDPGGPRRRIEAGHRADLCLLDRPWSAARETLAAEHVRLTVRNGVVVWNGDEAMNAHP